MLWLFDKKESHFRKYSLKKRYHAESKKKIFRKKKWRFLKKKQFRGKTSKVCFICRKLGHFAKNCPKREKVAKLLEQAQIHAEGTPFFWCRITLFIRWRIFSSSTSSHGILYNRRKLRFWISGLRPINSSHLYFPAYLGLFGSPIPIA